MAKKEVLPRMVNDYEYIDVCGNLNEFLESVRAQVIELVPSGCLHTARISLEKKSEPYSTYEYPALQVSWSRPETFEEMTRREEREKESAHYRRKQYEALKKEFGE
jgi:hypothetical protein